MKKEPYLSTEMDIIRFETEDIITQSNTRDYEGERIGEDSTNNP